MIILKKDPLQYLIANASEKKINYYSNEYSEQTEGEITKLKIDSLEELDTMYKTLDINKDYSNWYVV